MQLRDELALLPDPVVHVAFAVHPVDEPPVVWGAPGHEDAHDADAMGGQGEGSGDL
jgi:hypothetical protein